MYDPSQNCHKTCQIASAILGLIAFLIMWVSFDWYFLISLVLGVLIIIALMTLLPRFICSENDEVVVPSAGNAGPMVKPDASDDAAVATSAAVAGDPGAAAKQPVDQPVSDTAADEQGKPKGLDQARDGQPDDLTRIKGIGPKLRDLLHSMGFYHFDQIAAWTGEEIAWVDENLQGFKGRVTRDEWVAQAKILADGGDPAEADTGNA